MKIAMYLFIFLFISCDNCKCVKKKIYQKNNNTIVFEEDNIVVDSFDLYELIPKSHFYFIAPISYLKLFDESLRNNLEIPEININLDNFFKKQIYFTEYIDNNDEFSIFKKAFIRGFFHNKKDTLSAVKYYYSNIIKEMVDTLIFINSEKDLRKLMEINKEIYKKNKSNYWESIYLIQESTIHQISFQKGDFFVAFFLGNCLTLKKIDNFKSNNLSFTRFTRVISFDE